MKKFPWDLLLTLLAGFGLGLVYAWMISPLQVFDSEPAALRADFKDQFRSSIAASYAATGNLPRAQARLALLKDTDPIEALNAQAQRTLANGGSFAQADQLAALAFVLENGTNPPATATLVAENVEPVTNNAPTITPFPSPEDIPFITTETPQSIETQSEEPQPILATATARPTRTPPPTQGAPFTLTGQDTVCDPNLPDGLLQVVVYNSNRRQLPGIKIIITWENGEEQFFTGFKPEIGNGYADYLMTPDTAYTIQLGLGSDIATDLIAPTCQTSNGETYTGGFKITFQQP